MKSSLFLILFVWQIHAALGQVVQEDVRFVSQEEWLASVKAIRHGGGIFGEDILQYDEGLLREYYLHIVPKDQRWDLIWKIRGIAMFGKPQDIPVAEKQIAQYRQNNPGQDSWIQYAPDVILARHGDRAAARRVIKSLDVLGHSGNYHDLLWMCRTQAARDKLAERAADPNLDVRARYSALQPLGWLGDERFIQIATAPGAFRTFNDWSCIVQEDLAKLTGRMEFAVLESEIKARALIEKFNIRLSPPKTRISVQFGINWSKVQWDELK